MTTPAPGPSDPHAAASSDPHAGEPLAPSRTAHPEPEPPAVTPRTDRIIGLDLARFIALAGMTATHVWLSAGLGTDEVIWGSSLFEGRASALFAVLAGAGTVLATRAPLRDGRRAAARLMLLGRGTAVIVIGLTLTALVDPPILVILVYYGMLFWMLALVITWPRWALVVSALVVAVGAPIASVAVADAFGVTGREAANPSWTAFADPLELARGILFTGSYPSLIWLAYGLTGVLVGRALLRAVGSDTAGGVGAGTSSRSREGAAQPTALRMLGVRLVAIGAAIWLAGIAAAALVQGPLGGVPAVARDLGVSDAEALELLQVGGGSRPASGSPWLLAAVGPHSGTTLDLAVTAGFALTVIGLCVLLGTVLGPLARRILRPVTAAGAAPLTVYTAHVLLVGIVVEAALGRPYSTLTYQEYIALDTPWYLSSGGFYLANLLLALAIGAALAALRKRGPLETLVTWTGRRGAALARRSSRE
ncbi:heparan-alpha-glucosaminide N-acetyltransferase domain-containing protein [Herbiconiux solani]|uniref:heparan-alpha-glucosaminide N-acetyltransferase domain-containing protein n=1 Tax=Herbiconiux solani TaxID=661329 RepID=UPI0008252FA5|nr:heparan-alpha-glucosaminide N-acetyltransferase domain-containing protein [Herbiconiux solani]